MKNKHILTLLQENYTTVKVRFAEGNGKLYTYKAPNDLELKEFDIAVVYASGQYKVVTVMDVDVVPVLDLDAEYDYRWIVQKVDTDAYEERLEREKQFEQLLLQIERKKQQRAIRDELIAGLDKLPGVKQELDTALRLLNPDQTTATEVSEHQESEYD